MAESSLAVTPGDGLKLHTNTQSIGGTTVHDQVFVPGEGYLPTYTAIAASVSTATSADHLLFIQGDGTNYTRIRRITLRAVTPAGANSLADIRVLRTSTGGTAGGTVEARALDDADTTPYGGTVQTLPTGKGTEGDQLLQFRLPIGTAQPMDYVAEWKAGEGNMKPIVIGTATSDGICVKIQTGIGTATVDCEVEFTTSTF